MYSQVDKMVPVAQKYEQELVERGVITQDKAQEMKDAICNRLEAAYHKSKDHKFTSEEWATSEWEKIKKLDPKTQQQTGLPKD